MLNILRLKEIIQRKIDLYLVKNNYFINSMKYESKNTLSLADYRYFIRNPQYTQNISPNKTTVDRENYKSDKIIEL